MRVPMLKILFCAFGWLAICAAAPQPADPEAFTRLMTERMQREVPQVRIERAGPLQLRLSGTPGYREATINLDRVYDVCRQGDDEACETSIANLVAAIGDIAAMEAPLRREQLRVMVRGSDYCDGIRRQFAEAERPSEIVTRPVRPGLCALLVGDYPNSMRITTSEAVTELSLTPDAAWSLAAEQTAQALGPIAELDQLGDTLTVIAGREYVPSLMLDSERWRRLARTHGEIVVAVPGDGVVVAIKRSVIPDLSEFRTLIGQQYSQAERGISPRLYRWADNGWEEIR